MQKILISGLSGGSGKTIVSLGLTRFFTNNGYTVCPFKKGPDYIDAAWLMQASRKPCYCLDPFFLDDEALARHFYATCQNAPQKSIALIEGNRGLYDGKDYLGSCSTAHLAHTLDCPVLLTINCAKITRTTAALVLGIRNFDPKIRLAGVILNNIASARHQTIIRQSIEEYTDIPVLGAIPRLKDNPIPERHLGLSLNKNDDKQIMLDSLAELIADNTDTQKILAAAGDMLRLPDPPLEITRKMQSSPLNIAYLYDDAFWFYYQENFDELKKLGANLVPLSLLSEQSFAEQLQAHKLTAKDIDGLYIGGGYPELYAKEISRSPKLPQIKEWIEQNMPVYAECGGFMLLAKQLHFPEEKKYESYPMIGVFDIETKFFDKPQGLGYAEIKTIRENPYHPLGSIWKGHEFHFSTAVNAKPDQEFLFELKKGRGMTQKEMQNNNLAFDGLIYKNCFASYTHIFAPAVPHFSQNFIETARQYRKNQKENA